MSFDLNDAIKKCGDVDKDFRITAITDLTEELRKDSFHMDGSSENKVVDAVLRLLQDSAKEVQDVAVKSLGPLVRRVTEKHVTDIINTLSENIALTKRGDQEVREVSNSGLKAVLRDVDDKLGERVSNLLAPGLVTAIKSENQDVVQECLDVVNDLLTRFGGFTQPGHLIEIKDVTLPHLDSSRNLIRQRAIWVLTNVSKNCTEEAFAALMSALISKMSGGNLKKQATSIQLVGSIARSVGFRMGKHVNAFVPLLVDAVKKSSEDGDEDVKENAFQTFCSFVESCPRDIRPHIDMVLDLSLKFLSWDPNQLEDSDSEGGSDSEAGSDSDNDSEDESGSDESGMEASEDEDDDTWMVRRAAAKIITALLEHHPERLDTIVNKAGPALVKRFRERESTARHEVLGAYEAMAVAVASAGKSTEAYAAFSSSISKALSALAKLLTHKSVETRTATVSALATLGERVPGSLGEHLKVLVPGIGAAVQDSNTQLSIRSLDLLRQILNGSRAEVQPLLTQLFAPVQKLLKAETGNMHSKVAASVLDACEAFLEAGAGQNDFLNTVFSSFEPLFKQTELDAEAKEAAIRAAARAVCNLGSKMASLQATLDTLVERLSSELTREAAATAVGTICESGASVGDAWLSKAVPQLNSFCAPGARSLKIAALASLGFVYEHFGDAIKTHAATLDAVSDLIDVDDFTLAQLATHAATLVLHSNPKSVSDVKKKVYPRVQALLQSPLLEGLALASLAEMYHELALLEAKGFGFSELAKDLESLLKGGDLDAQRYRSVGACYAQLVVAGDAKKSASTVSSLIKQAGSKKVPERLAAIYVLAEVGRAKDVSEYNGLVEALASALDAAERPVALAASYALGSVAIGNLSKYLPFILEDMNKNPARQLLLLQAIKEIVSGQSSGASAGLRLSLSSSLGGSAAQDIAVHLDTLVPILLQHAASDDDLTRNAVSECLGRLAKIAPERIIAKVVEGCKDGSPFARASMVSALRYAVTDRASPDLDPLLTDAYVQAANAIADADIAVRLAGLQAVTWALNTKPRVVRPHLAVAMPAIYKETVIDQSLIKIIDLGQIKHVTDNGLDKRTAAYELLYVLLDKALDSVSVPDYVAPLTASADDVITIKETVYKIIRRLSFVAGGQLFAELDKLLPMLEKEGKRPIPKSDPNQDRALVMKRAALNAIIALNTIPNAAGHTKMQEMIAKVAAGPFKDEWVQLTAAQ